MSKKKIKVTLELINILLIASELYFFDFIGFSRRQSY